MVYETNQKIKLRRLKDIYCEFDVNLDDDIIDYVKCQYDDPRCGRGAGLVNHGMDFLFGRYATILSFSCNGYCTLDIDKHFRFNELLFESEGDIIATN